MDTLKTVRCTARIFLGDVGARGGDPAENCDTEQWSAWDHIGKGEIPPYY